jgi:hypothetical protein
MMIFIDSNIPMYLVGADHPHKRDTIIILEDIVSKKEKLVTNTEVLQEILHRYSAIKRKQDIQAAFDALYAIIDEIFVVQEKDILAAKGLLLSYDKLSARDALHAAQMKRLKINRILSFDHGFDALPDIQRLPQ